MAQDQRVVVSFDPSKIDWNSEDGQYMNLMFNMMGGLKEENLSQDEKDLIARVRARNEKAQK